MEKFDKQWWLTQGSTYMDQFEHGPAYVAQESALREVMDEGLNRNVDSIIEIGCGFGRITELVRNYFPDAEYTATDLTEEGLEVAKKNLLDKVKDIIFRVFDLDNDASTHPAADLVVAAEVLMHRRPEEIVWDVDQLAMLAKKYILTVDWWEPGVEVPGPYYQHDYMDLFGRYGSVYKTEVPSARQAIWLTVMD